jgi:hypothetical protein
MKIDLTWSKYKQKNCEIPYARFFGLKFINLPSKLPGWEQYVWLFALYVFVLFTLWGFYMPYVVI